MKKIICLLLASFVTLFIFAKEIPLTVTKTEWGFEVSNLTKKGKSICKEGINPKKLENSAYIILMKKGDTFEIDNLAEALMDEKKLQLILTIQNNKIESVTGNFNSSKNTIDYNMKLYDRIMLIPYTSNILECQAYCENNDFYYRVISANDEPSFLQKLVNSKKIEKKKVDEEQLLERKKLDEEKEQLEKDKKEKLKKDFIANGGEGFDYFNWGTSIESFLVRYPNAENVTKDEFKDSKYIVYCVQIDANQFQYYYFFDNALYYGETAFYKILNTDKINAITERLKELYGEVNSKDVFSDTKNVKVMGEPISYKEEGWWAKWNQSATFVIKEELTARYGIDTYYGSAQENTQSMMLYINSSTCDLIIDYSNPELEKKVLKYLEDFNKFKEEEKKQKEKEKLNF